MYVNSVFCCILFVLKKWCCFFSLLCVVLYGFVLRFVFLCFIFVLILHFVILLIRALCYFSACLGFHALSCSIRFVLFYVVFSNSRPLQGLEGFKRMHA